ncbi:hypothetical protein Tco_0116201 [Tanacetum coccineum]
MNSRYCPSFDLCEEKCKEFPRNPVSFSKNGGRSILTHKKIHGNLVALGITPKDPAHPFVAPPAEDLVIDFVNNLGYPEELQFVSKIHNIHKRPQSPLYIIADDYTLGSLKSVPKGELDEKSTKPTPSKKANKGKVIKVQKGKRSDRLVDEAEEEPLPASEPPMDDDEYNLQRGIQMSLESFQPLIDGHHNPGCEARAITTRSGLSYTPVPPIPPPLYDVNEPLTEKETEVTKDKVLPSTKDIQPPVIQKSHDPVKPVGSPISPEPSSAQVDNSPLSKEPSKETHLPISF